MKYLKLFIFISIIFIPFVFSKKSFTLVLDTTATMDSEIEVLKKNIRATLDGTSSNYEKYSLIYFNDPDVSDALVFPNVDAFISALNRIKASNGGDCPENSLTGIERALENSNKDSDVFVFTDAYAKEGGNSRNIIEMCRKNNVQVNILLTGTCLPTSKSSAGDVHVYYDITRSCSGNVLKLIPSNLTQAFRFMKEMIHGDWKEIHTEEPFSGEKEIAVSVDAYTTEVIIAISGDYLRVDYQTTLDASNHERIMEGRQILVERLIRPEHGEYRMTVSGHDTTVTVYKQVQFPFRYAFAPRQPMTFAETTTQPIPAVLSNVIIEVFDKNVKMNTLEILATNNDEKTVLKLEPGPGSDKMYLSEHYFKAFEPFKISVIGYDTIRNINVKGSTEIIEPQKFSVEKNRVNPEVRIVEPISNFVQYRGNATFACKVLGNPQPLIQWDIDGETLQSKDYLLELPMQYISYATVVNFKSNATINCKARNIAGDDYGALDLFVNRPQEFEITQSPQDQTIEFGEEERIHCDVRAYPEATKKWFKNDTEISDSDDQYIIEPHYLLIKNMSLENVGTFKCVVANEFRTETLSSEITISGLDVPEIRVSENELILSPGSWKEIECQLIKGLPKPILTWSYKSDQDYSFSSLPDGVYEKDHKLKIADVKTSHSGIYRCKAENFLAADEKDVALKVYYPPVLKTGDEDITVRVGQTVKFECDADANPEPEIRWEIYQNNNEMPLQSRHVVDEDNTLKFETTWEDSGEYKCSARNEIAETVKTIKLTVLVPPYIETPPSRLIYAKQGDTLSLKCHVLYGNPEPTVTWYFIAIDSRLTVLKKSTSRTSIIELNNISIRNEGLYKCVAENSVGTDRYGIKVRMA